MLQVVSAKPVSAEREESMRRIWSEAVALWPQLHSSRSWVDVGAHTWREIEAIACQLPQLEFLLGVEILAKRRLSWFQSVESLARKNAAPLVERGTVVDFCAGDFVQPEVRERVAAVRPDLLTFSYPFVNPRTARAWGMRRKQYHSFDALAQAAREVSPRAIFSIHQGEWEAEEAALAYARVFGQETWSRAVRHTVSQAPVHDAVLWFLPLA